MADAIRIKCYKDKIEAEIAKGLLETSNIKSFITADDAGGMRPDVMMATGGAWLWVSEDDIEQARVILEEEQQ